MGEVTWNQAITFLNVIAGSMALMLSLWITWNYARAYLKRAPGSEWRGLLPRHVLTIGLSYDLLVGLLMTGLLARINEPMTWRSPIYLLALLLGLWALRDMTSLQQHRKVSLPNDGRPAER